MKPPLWKTVALGLGGVVAAVVVLRLLGASGATLQGIEELVVFGAALSGLGVWLVKRQLRSQ